MKTCFKCKEMKPVDDFYRHSKMKDGRLGKCKKCTRKDAAQNRLSKIDYYRDYDRKRGNRQTSEYRKAYQKRFPEKYKARYAVSNAIRNGRLLKEPCAVCGLKKPIHAHHRDYSKPLEVIWLCPIHHFEEHYAPKN